MDEPLGVGGVQCPGNVGEDAHGPIRGQRPVGEQPPEIDAVDELHRHVEASGLLARVMDGDEIRVLDRGRQPGLAPEARYVVLVG